MTQSKWPTRSLTAPLLNYNSAGIQLLKLVSRVCCHFKQPSAVTARLVLFHHCRCCLLFGCAPCNVCFVRQDKTRRGRRGARGEREDKGFSLFGSMGNCPKMELLQSVDRLTWRETGSSQRRQEPPRPGGDRRSVFAAVAAASPPAPAPAPGVRGQLVRTRVNSRVSRVSSVPVRKTLPQLPPTAFSKTYDLIMSSYSAERGTRGESPPARRTE